MDDLPLPPLPKHPRRSNRVDKAQFVEVKIYRNGAEFHTHSRMVNLSPQGVGLLHPHRLDLGEQFTITTVQPDGKRVKMLYSVIYCNDDKQSGAYYIGGEFLCAVPQAA